MITDYEDDAHFCLKCQITIIGLDNYVSHRKAGCSKTGVVDLPKSPLPSQLLPPDDSFNLKADDFFSSLELQSSSKKLPPTSSTSTTTPAKNFSGILTRSKTTAVIQASSKEQSHQPEIAQSKSGKNVWIGGHQLKLGYGDNQTKLFKAVDQLERRKEELPKIDVFEESDVESEEYDYEDDESSDEENHDGPPRNHTGGKWKPSSPIQWNRPSSDWTVPGPSYTGGKWKPSKRAPSPSPPLLLHAKGGKWKPPEEEENKKLKGKKDENTGARRDAPSPSYTKGKWIPQEEQLVAAKKSTSNKISDDSPLRKSSGMVQYWCRPCNRRLSSKIVYERHIKSELHFKRILNDKEFDDHVGIIDEKRVKKKLDLESIRNENQISTSSSVAPSSGKKRIRKRIFIKCEVCKSKVNRNSMGKHLISHYHCRKGDIYTVKAQIMVLENISDIILQSPFQCSLCKFYFNHQKDFLQHWLSEFHSIKERSSPFGYFFCTLCQTKASTSSDMYQHLVSAEHEEVLTVINRSVPVVIKKLQPLECENCDQVFLLNIALMKHCQKLGHKWKTLSNGENYMCVKCIQIFRSNISLKRHKQAVHGETVFICTTCNKDFDSKDEARLHRNSSEHRYKSSKNSRRSHKCQYCQEIFSDFTQLKVHFLNEHKEHNSKCPRCGTIFAVPQELTVHLRMKACVFSESSSAARSSDNSCDKCPFSSDSPSELIFHKILHTPSLIINPPDPLKKPVAQYQCPFCKKFFPKASLQSHLRIHTEERPYVCGICSKGFVRKNNYILHTKNHSAKREKKQVVADVNTSNSRKFLCATCGANFKKKSILKQHMIVHTGKLYKCSHVGCIFSARSMGELERHFPVHTNDTKFSCQQCDYKGKTMQQFKRHLTLHTGIKTNVCNKCSYSARTSSHLARHMRLHTGAKPFSCPYCSYKCNGLENLRKHILSTGKHKGKYIYTCSVGMNCGFQTNFAKDFKVHLVGKHPEVFESGKKAASYIAGLYDASEGTEIIQEGDESNEEKNATVIVIPQQRDTDPLVAMPSGEDANNIDEMLPTFIVSRDDTISVDNLNETWNVVGSYDVEESGALVPFNSDNVLFQGHF